jgi:hypothetical protein
MRRSFFTLGLLLLSATTIFAFGRQHDSNGKISADGIWTRIDDSALQHRQAQRPIVPNAYQTAQLDLGSIRSLLGRTPLENSAGRASTVLMTIPMPDGTFQQFRIERSPVVEAGLIAKYPELGETFRGQGVDDPTATMRFDLLPIGFHAMILSTHDTVFVDPYATGDLVNYISYNKNSLPAPMRQWVCHVLDHRNGMAPTTADPVADVTSGTQLRTYRLALAADNEYAVAVGGNTVAGTLAAQVLIMNRVNGVYERDLAIHMNVIANNNLIVYAADHLCGGVACTTSNDHFNNDDPDALLDANQSNTDSVIGNANYDIGHVFTTGGGGEADLGVTCDSGFKAQGETGLDVPLGDAYAIDYVAHEMGHQWGADHTFNSTASSCGGGNRAAGDAYETGSGITIMAYAGICGAQDLAQHSIDTFHVKSLEEIVAYSQTSTGNTCAVTTSSGNTPPTVAVVGGPSFNIPKQTPFALTASSSDVNGDTVSYDWEEYDLGASSNAVPNTDATGARPVLRPYPPMTSPTRVFPSLQYILGNANTPPFTYDCGRGAGSPCLVGELLPQVARTMTFKVVARDNRANAGGINSAIATVVVDGTTGPFVVTAPNTGVSWAGNSNQTVTWNVAGTTGGTVNTANVKISLSTDAGLTFPTTLLASTPNDGTQSVTIPNTPTGAARINVEAVGSVYFDISDANFTITPGVTVGQKPPLDFDGDGKTDYMVTRDNSGTLAWYLMQSTNGFTGVNWGTTVTDVPVPGDYDGDNKWDIAIWRQGTPAFYYILKSSTNTLQIVPFGQTGDDPRITQDYDGDGKTDPAVTRSEGGNLNFYILRSTLGFTGVTFGVGTTDIGVRGDFDGDGKADVAVYRSGTGVPANSFFVLRSSDGVVQARNWGILGADYIVPGDFDGDGKTDYAIWRGATAGGDGGWYWLRSSDGVLGSLAFGTFGDRPVPGDYDGDGKTDQAVWRPGSPSTFYVNRSTSGFTAIGFGQLGDTPTGFQLQAR